MDGKCVCMSAHVLVIGCAEEEKKVKDDSQVTGVVVFPFLI